MPSLFEIFARIPFESASDAEVNGRCSDTCRVKEADCSGTRVRPVCNMSVISLQFALKLCNPIIRVFVVDIGP
jgi:hypothetical protein